MLLIIFKMYSKEITGIKKVGINNIPTERELRAITELRCDQIN